MKRRHVLGLIGGSAAVGLAGCEALVDDEDTDETQQTVLTGSVTGKTATIDGGERTVHAEIELAGELGIDPAYVRVSDGSVELLTDDLGSEAFAAALDAAGYDVEEITRGLTESTRQSVVDALESQLEAAEIDGEVYFEDGSLVVEAKDSDPASELTTNPDAVTIELSYPDPETDKNRRETVLAGTDFDTVGSAQQSQTGVPRVPVTLTDSAAERFATRLVETGFTQYAGRNVCEFDPSSEDGPDSGQYCILTVAGGEAVYGAMLNRNLAQSIESGRFAQDGSFVLTTTEMSRAEELAAVLQAGLPPVEVQLEEE